MDVGQGFDAVPCRVEHGGLESDQIAGQQEIQDLAAAVRQRFETEGPAGIKGVELRAVFAGANDLGAGWQRKVLTLHVGNGAEFVVRDGPEQTAGAQLRIPDRAPAFARSL